MSCDNTLRRELETLPNGVVIAPADYLTKNKILNDQEIIDALTGPQGPEGPQGDVGEQGPVGPAGDNAAFRGLHVFRTTYLLTSPINVLANNYYDIAYAAQFQPLTRTWMLDARVGISVVASVHTVVSLYIRDALANRLLARALTRFNAGTDAAHVPVSQFEILDPDGFATKELRVQIHSDQDITLYHYGGLLSPLLWLTYYTDDLTIEHYSAP